MRLADFIEHHARRIVDGAEVFARSQAPAGVRMESKALRNHIPQILEAIVLDLRTTQSAQEQQAKSEGRAPPAAGPQSAAASHGRQRAKSGFDINHMIAEYRALRASVLRLWVEDRALTEDSIEDMVRFNEAIDQAIAESVADFNKELESWRQVFLGVLGHDLRGPLGVIITTSELLSRMAQDSPYTEQTQRIVRSGMRMSKLLDDLLDYSRTHFGMGIRIVRKECDLKDELEQEIQLLREGLPKSTIQFRVVGSSRGMFDASRIREALSNLVTNASKYGHPGTDIVVSVKGDSDKVEVVVCNTGKPIPAGAVEAIFEPLRRGPGAATNGEHASLGLGLFIVREVVRAHNGEVSITSSNEKTEFSMRLPVNL